MGLNPERPINTGILITVPTILALKVISHSFSLESTLPLLDPRQSMPKLPTFRGMTPLKPSGIRMLITAESTDILWYLSLENILYGS